MPRPMIADYEFCAFLGYRRELRRSRQSYLRLYEWITLIGVLHMSSIFLQMLERRRIRASLAAVQLHMRFRVAWASCGLMDDRTVKEK